MPLYSRTSFFVWPTAVLLLLTGGASLFADNSDDGQRQRSGFYLSAQTAFMTSMTFPRAYRTYKSIGGAATPTAIYLDETGAFSSRPGFGLAGGYRVRTGWLTWGAEIEFQSVAVSDGPEVLTDDVWQDFETTETVRTFTQSGRSLWLLDFSAIFGAFPFRSFDLGFNVTAGAGYGRQSFTSPSVADAVGRGYDSSPLNGTESFDFGDYDGNGAWHRSSIVYFVGLGAEYELSRALSLRIDYKRVVSSYSRDNVLISSGAVNVYSDHVDYEYAVGNKFTIGLNYRI